jgi:integrase
MQEQRTPRTRTPSASTGITARHARSCTHHEGRCTCKPRYQAQVWSVRDRRVIRKTFPTVSAAKAWRQDASVALRKRTMQAPSQTTVRQAWEAWHAGALEGWVRTRSGDEYKPSALRGYEQAMRNRVLPEIGGVRLTTLTRVDLQDVADRWLAKGLDPSTIRNTLMPLRAMYRRALSRGEVSLNPTTGIELPAVRGRRERIATPEQAAALIAAASENDRALWATAFYAGLRRGELMALRWEDIDLDAGLIRVERSWDMQDGLIEPKTRAGKRSVPIATVLREHLAAHALRSGRRSGLVFGRTAERPFEPTTLSGRAATAWKHMNLKRTKAELETIAPVGLHECRHTFASLMIAAGVNAKALSTYIGHSSITITLDRYGHLMPGNETEAAELLDAYLRRGDVVRTCVASAGGIARS